MPRYEREVFLDLEPHVRVRYRRSAPPRPYRYAVTLETFEAGSWVTIRLWDNADVANEHHEHEYTRLGGKQPPEILPFASENEAMAAAIRRAADEWSAMLSHWSST